MKRMVKRRAHQWFSFRLSEQLASDALSPIDLTQFNQWTKLAKQNRKSDKNENAI